MQTSVIDAPTHATTSPDPMPSAPTARPRRSGRGVAIAGAVCLALGLAGAISLTTIGLMQIGRAADAVRTMPYTEAPGSDTISLGRGKQYIWIETEQDYAVAKPDITITVTRLRTEEPIPVTVTEEGVFDGGTAREWIYGTVVIPEDANYVIETTGGSQDYFVGFSRSDRSSELIGVGLLFAAIVLGTIFVVIGAVFLPVGLVQMYRSKRADAS